MQSTERHVLAADQSFFDISGEQAVFPRQVVQMLLESFVLELDGLHDRQILEQVGLVVVLNRERRLFHQVRYVRLVEFFQRFRVVAVKRGRQKRRRRSRDRRFFGAAGPRKNRV